MRMTMRPSALCLPCANRFRRISVSVPLRAEIDRLGLVQGVFVARPNSRLTQGTTSLETNITGVFTPVLAKHLNHISLTG
jgi:hypothetical protein